MVTLSVKSDVSKALRGIDRAIVDIPRITARALNRVAGAATRETRDSMRSVFGNPTPYVLNSLRAANATPKKLEARVWVKDRLEAGKGTDAQHFIGPQVFGGQRVSKRFERALARRLGIPVTTVMIPAKGATLDQYGNMASGQLNQIISFFGAFGEQGYRANSTTKTRSKLATGRGKASGIAYYYQRPGMGKQWGIYIRHMFTKGSAIRPVLIFATGARYRKRLDFFGIQTRESVHLGEALKQEVSRAFAQL